MALSLVHWQYVTQGLLPFTSSDLLTFFKISAILWLLHFETQRQIAHTCSTKRSVFRSVRIIALWMTRIRTTRLFRALTVVRSKSHSELENDDQGKP